MKQVLLFLLLWTVASFSLSQEGGEDPVDETNTPYVGNPQLAIPEFPATVEWINVDGRLSVQDLRGKVVIMDFWTYGCINCIHMIPVLHQLEEEYPDELVVIGVHSAKFENEGETENIQQIVQRYGVEHPVINDHEFIVWRTYGIRAWPTFVIIDPRGNVLAAQSGEIPYEGLKQVVDGMVDYFDSIDEINHEPLNNQPTNENTPSNLLNFPGKVLADVEGRRLFIADSSNHRITVADLMTYEILNVFGTGQRGYRDGPADEAQFDTPQGMALKDNLLYVADTNTHTIRTIDLETHEVDTLAGTGQIGRAGHTFNTRISEPLSFDMRSPWDVEIGDNTLFIAMAGMHQIWEINLQTHILRPSTGNGREALLNATRDTSELAQPSGLYFEDGLLYFADSESSSIRVSDYTNDIVMTVSGPNENTLFDFGDIDGEAGQSRLQHALGVDGDGHGLVYIADTYNSKIKVVDQTMTTSTLFGQNGNGGFADGGRDEATFDEPGGLDYVEFSDGSRKLFVADTNNHAIRVIDLDTEIVSTVQFPNPEALQIKDRVTVIGGSPGIGEPLILPETPLSAGEGQVIIHLQIPEGYKLNEFATSLAEFTGDDAIAISESKIVIDALQTRIPMTLTKGEGVLSGEMTIYFCEAINENLCFVDRFDVQVPVIVRDEGATTFTLSRELIPPQIGDNAISGL